jgi:hypothetical protein
MRTVSVLFLSTCCVCATLEAQVARPPDEIAKPRPDLVLKNPRERSPAWVGAIERLRAQPRAGEIQNAGVTAYITDVVSVPDREKAEIQKILADYDAAVLERAAKWEEDLKALRAQYEEKMIELLPDDRREPMRNALKISHDNWITGHDLQAMIERNSIERMKNLPPREKPDREKALAEVRAWLTEQRNLAKKKDEETLRKIRELLTPEEVKRLETFDRDRIVAEPEKKNDEKK